MKLVYSDFHISVEGAVHSEGQSKEFGENLLCLFV